MRPFNPHIHILAILVIVGCAGCGRHFVQVRSPNHPEREGIVQVAYGYVVFNYAPNSSSKKDLDLCINVLDAVDDPKPGPRPEDAITYWPTTEAWEKQESSTRLVSKKLSEEHCSDLLRYYDRDFARSIVKSLPPRAAEWDVFLFAQAGKPFNQLSKASPRVCVDLTNARLNDKFPQGLSQWRKLMQGGTERWAPSTFSDRVYQVLTFFFREAAKQDVHVDCQ